MPRDARGRFCSANTTNTTNNTEENTMRANNRENRMTALNNAGVNTSNFFNVNVNVPVGSCLEIFIDGVPYTFNSGAGIVGNASNISGVGSMGCRGVGDAINGIANGNVITNVDPIVQNIMSGGYVFNRKTDGRFVTAQTFKMLTKNSYNWQTRTIESGWDAFLRNGYGYMYQFEMMLDELHKLAKMERNNDADFARLSHFFTKQVVYDTCNHYMRQLKKMIKRLPVKKCHGTPYVKLRQYGNVFCSQLQQRVYNPLYGALVNIDRATTYRDLEIALRSMMQLMLDLPYNTPKCSQWKDAFKGKGAYVTLLNLIKFHGVKVVNAAGTELNTYDSVAYVESLLTTYRGEYWRFHEKLKAEIERNNFDLARSIQSQTTNTR